MDIQTEKKFILTLNREELETLYYHMHYAVTDEEDEWTPKEPDFFEDHFEPMFQQMKAALGYAD